jgi:hypothetical protein
LGLALFLQEITKNTLERLMRNNKEYTRETHDLSNFILQ